MNSHTFTVLLLASFRQAACESDLGRLIATESLFCIPQTCENGSSVQHGAWNISAVDTTVLDDLSIEPPFNRGPECCQECSCDVNVCGVEGTCCLHALDHLPTVHESRDALQMTCEYPQLRPYEPQVMANKLLPVLMIRKCLNRSDSDLVDKCEDPGKYDDIFTKVPVVDSNSLFSYHNRYCAACNSVDDENIVFWKTEVGCLNGWYNPVNLTSLARGIRDTVDCNLLYEIPDVPGLSVPGCYKVVSTCNETGLWKAYDPIIEAACLAYTAVYDYRYKNVFCYLCNTNDSRAPTTCIQQPGGFAYITYAALLKLPVNEEYSSTPSGSCVGHQIYDPVMGKCHELQCKFPKTLKGRKCVNAVDLFKGFIYEVYILLAPFSAGIHVDTAVLGDSVTNSVNKWLSSVNASLNTMDESSISFKGIYPEEYLFEEGGLDHVLVAFKGYFHWSTITVLDYILNINDTVFEVQVNTNRMHSFTGRISHWHSLVQFPYNKRTRFAYLPRIFKKVFWPLNRNYTIEILTKFHSCPHLEIPLTEVAINSTDDFFYLKRYESNVTLDDALLDDSSFVICLDTFQDVVLKVYLENRNSQDRQENRVKYIVSFVCVLISIMFSFLTFISYCFFQELRTQPGINNMFLSFYLTIAQTFFQFAYDVADQVSELSCIILGVLVHFTWLLHLMWMNVCSIHMFRVFCFDQMSINECNKLKTTGKYTVYCVAVATVPVIISIVTSLMKSGGTDVGYGGDFCYLTKSQIDIYLLAVPAFLIIGCNIILYVVVVIQIARVKLSVENCSENRSFASSYAKLSTLTGGTWVFGFVYLFTEHEWAEYTFLALNATQGLFLFVAFVVNGSPLRFLLSRVCGKQQDNQNQGVNNDILRQSESRATDAVTCVR